MAIILTFSTESPRGPVTLTADLSGFDSYKRGEEIRNFFESITSLQCGIYEVERKDQEIQEAYQAEKQARDEKYPEVVTCDPIMVIS